MAINMNIQPVLLDQITNKIKLNASRGNDFLSLGDGLVQFGQGLPDIAASVYRSHPGSVNLILIGPTNRPGWNSLTQGDSTGSLTVLIGLLPPALMTCWQAASVGDLSRGGGSSLKLALSPGGRILFVSGDGKLL
jgi:hypothetical protein